MNIGLDIHGVIDRYPLLFKKLTERWAEEKNHIHIVTGQESDKSCKVVKDAGIVYHSHFSIVDHHKSLGTEMWQDDKGTWWMDKDKWDSSKGEYAKRWDIQLHFDDSICYAQYFPDNCIFVHVPKFDFEHICRNLLDSSVIL